MPFISTHEAVIVEINEAYDYDVLKANRSITVGNNSATAEGFEIAGQPFSQVNSVNLNITGLGILSSVNYDITCGTQTESRSISTLGFYFGILYQIYQPILTINDYSNASEWDQVTAEEPPGILMYPFLNNDTSTWDYLLGYVDDAINGTLLESYPGTEEIVTNGAYVNTTSYFECEIYFEGIYHHNVSDGSELILVHSNMKHNLKMAYNKTNGVMLGIRTKGTLSGVADDTVVYVDYEQHTELQGFNLDNFAFGVVIPTPTPTPSKTIGMPIIPVIFGFIIFIATMNVKKRKK
jgi:hypothetical protein